MTQPPPYKPAAEASTFPTREDLRTIAFRQQILLVCILFNLAAMVMRFFLGQRLVILSSIAWVAAGVVGAVFVLLLAIKVFRPVLGILLAVLTVVPIVGLLSLLIVNGKATSLLKEHGVRVGLLGADHRTI